MFYKAVGTFNFTRQINYLGCFYWSKPNYLNVDFLSTTMLSNFSYCSISCFCYIITAFPNCIISAVRRYIKWSFQHFLI